MATQSDAIRALALLRQAGQIGAGGPKGYTLNQMKQWGYSRPTAAGGKAGSSAIGEIGGAFKSAGSAVLNTLSVPQALGFYALSNIIGAGQILAGKKDVKTMGVSDLAGNFSKDYGGFGEVLTNAGADPKSSWVKWAGLAGDIVLDPLWLAAPAKIVKGAGTVAKLAEGADRFADAARIAQSVSKDAGTTAMLGKFKDSSNIGKVGRELADATKVTVKRNHTVKVDRGTGLVDDTARDLQSVKGDLLNGRFLVVQTSRASKKAGGQKAEYKMFDLGEDATVLRSDSRAFDQTFKNRTEARDFLKAALEENPGKAPKTTEKLVQMLPEGVADMNDFRRGINWNAEQVKEIFNGGKNQMGIKFGWGKKNPAGGRGLTGQNYLVNTKIPLPANKTLGTVTGLDKLASFRRSPFEKSVHQLSRSANEMGNAQIPMWAEMAKRAFNLTDEQAELVGHAGILDNRSLPGADDGFRIGQDVFVNRLRSEGLWNDEMDRALNFVRERQMRQGERMGKGNDTFRGVAEEERAQKEFVDAAYQKAYDKAIKKGASKEKAAKAGDKAAEKAAEKYRWKVRGEYLLQTPTRESLHTRAENAGDLLTSGKGSKTMRNEIHDVARQHESALNYFTKQQYIEDLVRLGVDERTARELAQAVEGEAERLASGSLGKYWTKEQKKTLGFADEPGDLRAETNIFKLGAYGDRRYIRHELHKAIDDLAVEAGLGSYDEAGKFVLNGGKGDKIYQRALKTMDGGLLADSVGWNKYLRFVGGVKMYLTSMQPQHYSSNTFGDWFKDFVQGNWRHLKFPTASLQFAGKRGVRATKGSKYAKIADADPDALKNQIWTIGGHEYTGEEVFFMSHMVGLGKGYAGDEILNMTRLYEEADGAPGIKQFKQYVRWSARQNAVREDATRLQAWMKWMEGGDDPMTAGLKTITSHFDYSDLTDFEKTFLRNFILFYTWSRKNIPFQFKGAAMRPGLYSAYGDIEHNREKMPGEPGYIGEMGLLPVPALGQFYMFAPHTDMYKVPLAEGWGEAFRRNVLGATPPGLKQAIEIGTGKDMFTGAGLPNYPGETKTMLGMEMPWQAAYAIKQLGPFGSQANAQANGNMNVFDRIARITGVGRRVNPDPKWTQKKTTKSAHRALNGG